MAQLWGQEESWGQLESLPLSLVIPGRVGRASPAMSPGQSWLPASGSSLFA